MEAARLKLLAFFAGQSEYELQTKQPGAAVLWEVRHVASARIAKLLIGELGCADLCLLKVDEDWRTLDEVELLFLFLFWFSSSSVLWEPGRLRSDEDLFQGALRLQRTDSTSSTCAPA